MTSRLRRLGTFAMAVAIALYADVATSQSAGEPQGYDHQGHDAATLPGSPGDGMMNGMMNGMMSGMMKRHDDAMARGTAMDDRINALVADMNMFTGEFKVMAMAALLTAIVQRQSVMRDEMRHMHGEMMGRMMERRALAASLDEEPGTLCAPSR